MKTKSTLRSKKGTEHNGGYAIPQDVCARSGHSYTEMPGMFKMFKSELRAGVGRHLVEKQVIKQKCQCPQCGACTWRETPECKTF